MIVLIHSFFEQILGGGGFVTKSCPTLMSPWTIACQAHLSMGFFQERILEWVAVSFTHRY